MWHHLSGIKNEGKPQRREDSCFEISLQVANQREEHNTGQHRIRNYTFIVVLKSIPITYVVKRKQFRWVKHISRMGELRTTTVPKMVKKVQYEGLRIID